MEKEEEVGRQIKEWTGMDFASPTRVAEDRTRWKGVVCEVICGAPTTMQGYGIDCTRLDGSHFGWSNCENFKQLHERIVLTLYSLIHSEVPEHCQFHTFAIFRNTSR